jgi:hypothetical protein
LAAAVLVAVVAADCGAAVDSEDDDTAVEGTRWLDELLPLLLLLLLLLLLGIDVQEEPASLVAALSDVSACSAEPIDSGAVEGSGSSLDGVSVVAEGCAVGFAAGALLAEAAGTRLEPLPLLFLLLSLPPPLLLLLEDESEAAPP